MTERLLFSPFGAWFGFISMPCYHDPLDACLEAVWAKLLEVFVFSSSSGKRRLFALRPLDTKAFDLWHVRMKFMHSFLCLCFCLFSFSHCVTTSSHLSMLLSSASRTHHGLDIVSSRNVEAPQTPARLQWTSKAGLKLSWSISSKQSQGQRAKTSRRCNMVNIRWAAHSHIFWKLVVHLKTHSCTLIAARLVKILIIFEELFNRVWYSASYGSRTRDYLVLLTRLD